MIIVDLSQVMLSNLMMLLGKHTNTELDENMLRHMILNSIRRYRVKFGDRYGEMVIACDDKNTWRRDVFPYYKANRKEDRDNSELDWNMIFTSLGKIKEELKEHFPYRVLQIDRAEADDIIGTLAKAFSTTSEKVLILSGDRDFKQLQKYKNVSQYDPVNDRHIEEEDPARYLKRHIMKGDKGDGVPNFLSSDDCIITKTRQKSVMEKKLLVWLEQEPEEFCTPEMLARYRRNEILVDLEFTPKEIQDKIIQEYHSQSGKDSSKLFNYFVEHRLKHLMSDISQF